MYFCSGPWKCLGMDLLHQVLFLKKNSCCQKNRLKYTPVIALSTLNLYGNAKGNILKYS